MTDEAFDQKNWTDEQVLEVDKFIIWSFEFRSEFSKYALPYILCYKTTKISFSYICVLRITGFFV